MQHIEKTYIALTKKVGHNQSYMVDNCNTVAYIMCFASSYISSYFAETLEQLLDKHSDGKHTKHWMNNYEW